MHKDILVIDDNPDIRFLICNILKEQHFNVRSAANFDQAVLEINKKLPDLAIIDIKLDKTDKDGIDLLKQIISKNKSVPIIMISGHATVQIAVEAIRLGAYEFIEKPFSKEKILNYVNRALENASLKKEKDIIENKLFHSFELIGKSNSITKSNLGASSSIATNGFKANPLRGLQRVKRRDKSYPFRKGWNGFSKFKL